MLSSSFSFGSPTPQIQASEIKPVVFLINGQHAQREPRDLHSGGKWLNLEPAGWPYNLMM